MKKLLATLAIATLGLGVLPAQAADVDVRWPNPEKYRDIKASNGMGQKAYQQRVFDELTRHFALAAARDLPAGQTLNVVVTDLDLAGYVEYFVPPYYQGIRIVDDLYFPSISFDWQLLDETDQVLAEGRETLKDMSFLRPFNSKLAARDTLFYEKQLIDGWMRTTFFDPDRT